MAKLLNIVSICYPKVNLMNHTDAKGETHPVSGVTPKDEKKIITKKDTQNENEEKNVEPEHHTESRELSQEIKLFEDETIKLKLNPHPFSFMHFYIHGIGMILFGVIFGILFFSSGWGVVADKVRGFAQMIGLGNGDTASAFVVWGIFMIILAVTAWKTVDDVGIWYALLYILILVLAVAIGYFTSWDYRYFIPAYMILLGILMLAVADMYRRAFRYYITNHRIVIIKRFLTHDEIFLRYRNIVDLDVHQGFWARLFGYGTIIPITPSGIGTGTDSVTIAGDAARGNLLEKGVREERIISTTRSVATSRAKPDECLYGVKDPFGVKTIVADAMDKLSEDTQLREIRELLKKQKEETL